MPTAKTVLPKSVIISLYKNSLYREIPGNAGGNIPGAEVIPYLGNNSKKVLLIVRFEMEAFLPERHLGFIAKMLSACKMNIGDVAIVNDKHRTLSVELLYDQLRPLRMILFGIDPRELNIPVDLPAFSITAFKDCQLFHTPNLDALNQESSEAIIYKKKLWGCLKQAFIM